MYILESFCFIYFFPEFIEEKGFPPEFIKAPHQVVAREHDCAKFLVRVVGMPVPTGIFDESTQLKSLVLNIRK